MELGGETEFRRANRREIGGVREQHGPFIAQPFVETYTTKARFLFEIRRRITEAKA